MNRAVRPEDAAWLGMRHRGGQMVIEAQLRLAGDLTAADLRRLLVDRCLTRFPELAQGAPDGEVGRAVTERSVPGPVTDDVLDAASAADRGDPLPDRGWTMVVVRSAVDPDAGAGVLVRLHHALGDGSAVLALLDVLLDPGTAAGSEPGPTARVPRPPAAVQTVAGALAVLPVGLAVVARGLGRQLPLTPSAPADSGDWTTSHDLAVVRAAARACGVTVNDVLLAAVAGGLRAVLLAAGETPRDARVIVPVDLRRRPVTRLGNHLGVASVRLPVSVDGRPGRLAAVHRRTRGLRRSPEPQATWLLLRAVGLLPRALHEVAGDVLGASVDGLVTNVRGPRERRSLAGAELLSVRCWVPRVGSAVLGVSLLSYAGSLTIGVVGTAVPVAEAVDHELRALTRQGE